LATTAPSEPKSDQAADTQPVWRLTQTASAAPAISAAAAAETTAAADNKGRRENAPVMVRLCSAINMILKASVDGQAGLGSSYLSGSAALRVAKARRLCAECVGVSTFMKITRTVR
jgi:hypothetical protein